MMLLRYCCAGQNSFTPRALSKKRDVEAHGMCVTLEKVRHARRGWSLRGPSAKEVRLVECGSWPWCLPLGRPEGLLGIARPNMRVCLHKREQPCNQDPESAACPGASKGPLDGQRQKEGNRQHMGTCASASSLCSSLARISTSCNRQHLRKRGANGPMLHHTVIES